MTPGAPPAAAHTSGLGVLHWLLGGQSVIVILLSLNRLSPWTRGVALPHEGLRWVDVTNMLVWPLVSSALSYGALRWIEGGRGSIWWHGLLLLVSVYLLAAGYGNHEVTNYLHQRFCAGDGMGPESRVLDARLCEIVVYNDDDFSHLVFFVGFVGVTLALLVAQAAHPRAGSLPARDRALLGANAVFLGLAVFANLAFEETGLDLPVVLLVAALAAALWRRARRRGDSVPVVAYTLAAYAPSGLAVAVAKLSGLSQ